MTLIKFNNRNRLLPKNANPNKEVKASYKDGILKLNLLKKEADKALPKEII